MIVTELTLEEIRAVILDMRLVAAMDRRKAFATPPCAACHERLSNAILNEHWAGQLERALAGR